MPLRDCHPQRRGKPLGKVVIHMGKSIHRDSHSRELVSETDRKLAYLPSVMGQISLFPIWKPKPGTTFMQMTNGNKRITITPATPDDWPFGMIPRKFLMMCATLIQTKDPCVDGVQRIVFLDGSWRSIARRMGINSGQRNVGNVVRQVSSIAQLTIHIQDAGFRGNDRYTRQVEGGNVPIVRSYHFEFSQRTDGDDISDASRNYVQFTKEAWDFLLTTNMPAYRDVLDGVGSNSLAFDILDWASYRRYHGLSSDLRLTWPQLKKQFGAISPTMTEFRRKFRKAAQKAAELWPDLGPRFDSAGQPILDSAGNPVSGLEVTSKEVVLRTGSSMVPKKIWAGIPRNDQQRSVGAAPETNLFSSTGRTEAEIILEILGRAGIMDLFDDQKTADAARDMAEKLMRQGRSVDSCVALIKKEFVNELFDDSLKRLSDADADGVRYKGEIPMTAESPHGASTTAANASSVRNTSRLAAKPHESLIATPVGAIYDHAYTKAQLQEHLSGAKAPDVCYVCLSDKRNTDTHGV